MQWYTPKLKFIVSTKSGLVITLTTSYSNYNIHILMEDSNNYLIGILYQYCAYDQMHCLSNALYCLLVDALYCPVMYKYVEYTEFLRMSFSIIFTPPSTTNIIDSCWEELIALFKAAQPPTPHQTCQTKNHKHRNYPTQYIHVHVIVLC